MRPSETYCFGPFRLDTSAYQLFNRQTVISAPPKVLDLLHLLLSQPSTLVTKEAILARLWPGVAVTDNAITQVVSELRQALGDDATAPAYLQTVPRRGYRFIGTVTIAAAPEPLLRRTRQNRRTIGVAYFENLSHDPDVAWLDSGIAETVSNDLRALRDLAVIDRTLLPELASHASLDAARAVSLDWLVRGGFQRSGDRLRITAHVIDVSTGDTIAQARTDGVVSDAFSVQDQLVTQLLADLHVPISEAAAARIGTRETSSIEAYRALTQGRIRLESLDPDQVIAAIDDFDRALTLDPRYALAYVGLAEARFWLYERSRARNQPDRDELRVAIAHARRAVQLDAGLGEAHAALALLLASAGLPREAIDSGRRAVALEPNDWRHRFRLGVAAWGQERLVCLADVERLFPDLAQTYLCSAMVHVARGQLVDAREVLERGLERRDPARVGSTRFPSNGLHWLLGLVVWATGDDRPSARAAFHRELTVPGSALYSAEYAMNAYDALGFLALAEHNHTEAEAMFGRALDAYPDHARSLIGRAQACDGLGLPSRAAALLEHADRAVHELAASGRTTESAMARAYWLVANGDSTAAGELLSTMLDTAPPGFAGWTLPIEPWCRGHRAIGRVLVRLRERAR